MPAGTQQELAVGRSVVKRPDWDDSHQPATPHQAAAPSVMAAQAARSWSSSTYSSGLCAWAMRPGPKMAPGIPTSAYQASSEAAVNASMRGSRPTLSSAARETLDKWVIRRGLGGREIDVAQFPGEARRMLAQPGIRLAHCLHERFDFVADRLE